MIEIQGKMCICTACGWHTTLCASPSILAAYSPALAHILTAQSTEQLYVTLARHEAECSRIPRS